MKKYVLLLFLTVLFSGLTAAQPIMPIPASTKLGQQRFSLDQSFYVVVQNNNSERVIAATKRFLSRLNEQTHLMVPINIEPVVKKSAGIYLMIRFSRIGTLFPGEDESYRLVITGDQIMLEAETDLGVLHGLETMLQLVQSDEKGYFCQGASIDDKPRFVWRGLLIDVCRHWMPMEVIKRNIDGMAMVKLNVLHLHLSDDQGFRVESKSLPKLHLLGSDGNFFTQEQIKEVIRYAGERGIRVVPEFDMPGHASSWMPGYPELSSASGPYKIETGFGVFDPAINPTSKKTYKILGKLIGEMSKLFPDPYFHIGGDENNGKQWDSNPEIRNFKKKNKLKDNHALQQYFNEHLMSILKKNGKKMIGWDEILEPGLSKDAVIQSWRGKEGLKEAASKGYQVILSNGFYIDLCQPAWKHYANDPVPDNVGITPEESKNILGGEATMWSELVTPETIDSRIWPRTAAIAERLWSPKEINNIPDMYERLERMSIRLESAGLLHLRNRDMMLRRIKGDEDIKPLVKIIELVEPLKDYARHSQGISYSTSLPLTRMPDIATPDADKAREFRILCEAVVRKNDNEAKVELKKLLKGFIKNEDKVEECVKNNPALESWREMSEQIAAVSKAGLECLDFIERRQVITDEWTKSTSTIIQKARKPIDECELMIVDGVNMLFNHALPK